jgi:hypothetical protein
LQLHWLASRSAEKNELERIREEVVMAAYRHACRIQEYEIGEHIACMGRRKINKRILVWKPGRKSTTVRHRHRWKRGEMLNLTISLKQDIWVETY